MRIRSADSNDVALIGSLIRELAEYEKSCGDGPGHRRTAARDVLRAGAARVLRSCRDGRRGSLRDGGVVSQLLHVDRKPRRLSRGHLRSTRVSTSRIRSSAARAPRRECVAKGYPRLQWWVLDWNAPSIDFYRSLGAEAMGEWTVFRLSGDALEQLASSK